MPDAVIFDLDGTLVDRASAQRRAAAAMLAAFDRKAPDLATFRDLLGDGTAGLVRACLGWAGVAAGHETTARALYDQHYPDTMADRIALFDGAHETIEALRAGGLAVGLATKKPHAATERILETLQLGPFDAVSTRDRQPATPYDPTYLRVCCARLGVTPDQAVFVGDSSTDAHVARALSIRLIHMAPGRKRRRLAVVPWHIVRDLREIPLLLGLSCPRPAESPPECCGK